MNIIVGINLSIAGSLNALIFGYFTYIKPIKKINKLNSPKSKKKSPSNNNIINYDSSASEFKNDLEGFVLEEDDDSSN